MKLSREERIKRAQRIREEKELFNKENKERYLQSLDFKIQKIISLIFTAYLLITFIPYEPSFLCKTEFVRDIDNRLGSSTGRVIYITTNLGNEYQIFGRVMGKHAFRLGDEIISRKNILLKTRNIVHLKYGIYYPIDKQLGLLIFFAALVIVMVILLVSKDYRMEKPFYTIILGAFVLFALYLDT
jgi:hypothetical protein